MKSEAATIVQQLLASGHISQHQSNVLQSAIHDDGNEDDIIVPGNVTVGFDVKAFRNQLEAASRVFNTPELLENILLYSDPTELLLHIQLTCKGFYHATHTSLSLRRKLFLGPDYKQSVVTFFPFNLFSAFVFRQDYTSEKPLISACPESFACHITWLLMEFEKLKSYNALQNHLLTQPPLRSATVYLCGPLGRCGEGRLQRHVRPSHVAGVSIGDVLEAVDAIFEEAWSEGLPSLKENLLGEVNIVSAERAEGPKCPCERRKG